MSAATHRRAGIRTHLEQYIYPSQAYHDDRSTLSIPPGLQSLLRIPHRNEPFSVSCSSNRPMGIISGHLRCSPRWFESPQSVTQTTHRPSAGARIRPELEERRRRVVHTHSLHFDLVHSLVHSPGKLRISERSTSASDDRASYLIGVSSNSSAQPCRASRVKSIFKHIRSDSRDTRSTIFTYQTCTEEECRLETTDTWTSASSCGGNIVDSQWILTKCTHDGVTKEL